MLRSNGLGPTCVFVRRILRGGVSSLGVVGLSMACMAGCSAVLGIEDLGAAPPLTSADSGSGGAGGSSGADASTGGGPGESGGGGAAGSSGGSSAGAGGSVPDGSAGAGGGGNGGAGGQAGAGGGPADGGTPVKGTVIDYFRHKVQNAVVTIGGTTVNTDSNGAFTIPGVTGTYDVSLVVSYSVFGQTITDGWLFQGLTRKDPTLQVYHGGTLREAEAILTFTGPTFPLGSLQTIGLSFASPDGIFTDSLTDSGFDYSGYDWHGTSTTQGAFHALLWTTDTAGNVASTYDGYDSKAATLNESTPLNLSLNLKATASIVTKNVSGSVTGSANSRENDVYVRFLDGAAIQVAHDYTPTANFAYKVPTLTNGGISFAAVDGSPGYAPVSIAYEDDLVPGQTGLTFDIPSAQSLLGPVENAATVSSSTAFAWSGPGGISVFTILIDPQNRSDTMTIVTTQKAAKLPSFPQASFSIAKGTACIWFVEEHGTATTMDAAAGSTGFLDPFAYGDPRGPRRGKGTYTESEHRDFTTAP